MKYLELVESNKGNGVMVAIIKECASHGLDILEANNWHVVVKAACLPVEITWEMCSCHGGRMWLSQKNTGIYIELSSDTYDEDLGIYSPETELAYYIENKMYETIRSFEGYVYVVETVGKYSDDKRNVTYYNSVEKASYAIFEESGHDVNSVYGKIVHQHPNPDRREEFVYVDDEDGKIHFKCRSLCRRKGESDFKTEREYDIYYHVFRKKR